MPRPVGLFGIPSNTFTRNLFACPSAGQALFIERQGSKSPFVIGRCFAR